MAQSGYGTVRDFPNFNIDQDCQVLHKAMKGLGTDEDAIIQVLAHRSNSQRLQLRAAFKQRYGQVCWVVYLTDVYPYCIVHWMQS